MSRRLMLVLAAAVVVVAVAVTGGIAIAGGVGGDDQPLTGAPLQKANAAALAHTGGGTVTESEVGDDGAAYDVEVRLANGKTVDVQLDSQYQVIGQEANDDGGTADDDGANGDGAETSPTEGVGRGVGRRSDTSVPASPAWRPSPRWRRPTR